eukprot:TRINITY_DN13819_c3_g1_i1.p1 TRINITY_DN13819_c3_g1~~TRINITY_DN13819_c3_g1_i1.p1  ORF type:complete len:284 (+),score=25.36 TRINITY_DN13819_c3_g1_i1:78-854(+)
MWNTSLYQKNASQIRNTKLTSSSASPLQMRSFPLFKPPFKYYGPISNHRHVVSQVADPFAPPQIDNVIPQENTKTAEGDFDSSKYQPFSSSKLISKSKACFTQFSIYKGKSAMQVSLIPPTWAMYENGAKMVSKEGVLLLQFAKSTGPRQYDWNSKVMFAMSALEIGQIIDAPKDNDAYSFFHDPNMNNSSKGSVTKSLKIQQDTHGTAFFFSVQQLERGGNKTNISVPVSKSEYNVIANIAQFSIPYMLGFDEVFKQ